MSERPLSNSETLICLSARLSKEDDKTTYYLVKYKDVYLRYWYSMLKIENLKSLLSSVETELQHNLDLRFDGSYTFQQKCKYNIENLKVELSKESSKAEKILKKLEKLENSKHIQYILNRERQQREYGWIYERR